MRISLVYLLCLCLPSLIQAQDFEYAQIQVRTVSFGGSDLDIRKDDGTGFYLAPQWVADGISQPAAYVSGTAPVVAAALEMTCTQHPDSAWVRAIGPEDMEFGAVKVALVPVSGDLMAMSYPFTPGSQDFAAGITRFFSPYTIRWEVSLDEGTTWRHAGDSESTVYVTKRLPMPEDTRYKWFHSVFDISCRNTDMLDADSNIIAGIWNDFTDHVMLNHEGDSLHYYKKMNTYNVTLGSLLKYRDAQCYTFAQLFLSTIKIQGIIRTNNYVFITPINNPACGYSVNRFVVKDWTFAAPTGGSECPDFPYKNTYDDLIPPPFDSYSFLTEDVTDQIGIPGASTANPSSYFNNHQITFIDGVFYDPCYGVTFDSISDIPTEAFSGWGFRYTTGGWGGITNAFFTNDMSKSSLSATFSTF